VDLRYAVDERPNDAALRALWLASWGRPSYPDSAAVLARSLCYVCAYAGEELVGFVNVAWDGGVHASVFDTCVHPAYVRVGIGTALVRLAATEAARRGAEWLQVDFEPHLTQFYHQCGFRHTEARLMPLTRGDPDASTPDVLAE
jgi:GNAT superfamily N-acetyltransferase